MGRVASVLRSRRASSALPVVSAAPGVIPIDLESGEQDAPPAALLDMLAEAESRAGRFLADAVNPRIPALVNSNYRIALHALRQVAKRQLAVGPTFCEWGSGLGIVTCLASRLGFDAVGIEIEPRLVAEARRFAAEFAPAARFFEGSYQPAGLFTETVDASQLDKDLGFSPTAFDLIYVFPWPAEERAATRLFEQFGRDDGLLLSFHGGRDIRLQRRVADRAAGR